MNFVFKFSFGALFCFNVIIGSVTPNIVTLNNELIENVTPNILTLKNEFVKIIVNILPWTNAEYEQLKGRVFRQGQTKPVEIVIPITNLNINGEEKSWCKSRLSRIKFKKTGLYCLFT